MINNRNNEVEHYVASAIHRGLGHHHRPAGNRGRVGNVVHCSFGTWRCGTFLLLLLCHAANAAEIAHPLLNVTNYNGQFAMYHETDIHPVAVVGHIAFEIDLDKEMAYIKTLKAKFFDKNDTELNLLDRLLKKTKPNPLTANIMSVYKELDEERARTYGYLKSLQRVLPKFHPANPDLNENARTAYAPKTTRQKRQIPFLSFGLGIANAVHLAILDGYVGQLDQDVQNTMLKVDSLAKITAVNAEQIVKIVHSLDNTQNEILVQNQYLYSVTVGVALISTMQTAIQHLKRVSAGLQCLLNHQLPMDYFDVNDVKQTFDEYVAFVSPQNLEPVSLSPLQLFQNKISFVLLVKGDGMSNITLSVLGEIALQTKHVGLVSVYRPEETIIQVKNSGTLWNYKPKGMLLAGTSGDLAEVDDSYLDTCLEAMGPQGKSCPRAPSIGSGTTCLSAIYQQASNLSVCHEEMNLMDKEQPYITQLRDLSFLAWNPRERQVHVDCSMGLEYAQHTSHTLSGLQRIVIAPGCSLRIGDYRAHRVKEPTLAPVKSFIIGEDFNALIRMLDLDEQIFQSTYDDIMEMSADNRHLLSTAELNLQKVQQLVQSPLHRTTSRFLPYMLFGVSSVVLLVIISVAIYCCRKKYRARRARLAYPPAPPRKKKKQQDEEAMEFTNNIDKAAVDYLGNLATTMSKQKAQAKV